MRVTLLAVVLTAIAVAGSTPAAAAAAYTRQGVLTCNVEASLALIVTQSKAITCSLARSGGGADTYTGSLRKVGLTGFRVGGGVIAWAVWTSAGAPRPGDLGGSYFRAAGDEAATVGAGPRILIGGGQRRFALQPVSASGGIDLDYAENVTGLVLDEKR